MDASRDHNIKQKELSLTCESQILKRRMVVGTISAVGRTKGEWRMSREKKEGKNTKLSCTL